MPIPPELLRGDAPPNSKRPVVGVLEAEKVIMAAALVRMVSLRKEQERTLRHLADARDRPRPRDRIALGQDPASVRNEVLLQGARLSAISAVIGIGAALLLTRSVASLLYGVKVIVTRVGGLAERAGGRDNVVLVSDDSELAAAMRNEARGERPAAEEDVDPHVGGALAVSLD